MSRGNTLDHIKEIVILRNIKSIQTWIVSVENKVTEIVPTI
jgi:hypothetical protein